MECLNEVVLLDLVGSLICLPVAFPCVGQFYVYVCPVSTPGDFYPMFWSSSGSGGGGRCVYEAAYPRDTLPLAYFGVTSVLLLAVRLPLTVVCWKKHPHNNSVCVGLIAVPCLAALHVALSGLLCKWLMLTCLRTPHTHHMHITISCNACGLGHLQHVQ